MVVSIVDVILSDSIDGLEGLWGEIQSSCFLGNRGFWRPHMGLLATDANANDAIIPDGFCVQAGNGRRSLTGRGKVIDCGWRLLIRGRVSILEEELIGGEIGI